MTEHTPTEHMQRRPFAHRAVTKQARSVARAEQQLGERRPRERTVRRDLFNVVRDTMKTFELS